MLRMTAKEMRSLLKYSALYLFLGFLLAVLGFGVLNFGQFCGTMAMFLGACVVAFDDWAWERERWKITAVFLILGIVAYVVFAIAQIQGIVKPPNANPVLIALDIAIATMVAWKTLRFLSTITCVNWHVTKSTPPASSFGQSWGHSTGIGSRYSGIPSSIYWRHS